MTAKKTKSKPKKRLIRPPQRRVGIALMAALLIGVGGAVVFITNRDTRVAAVQGINPHACSNHPQIGRGSVNSCVAHLQYDLNAIFFFGLNTSYTNARSKLVALNDDGDFGPKTEDRVRLFQKITKYNYDSSLAVDGIVGPKTWSWIHTHSCYFVTNC